MQNDRDGTSRAPVFANETNSALAGVDLDRASFFPFRTGL